jgi:hypothetical protein
MTAENPVPDAEPVPPDQAGDPTSRKLRPIIRALARQAAREYWSGRVIELMRPHVERRRDAEQQGASDDVL